MQSRVGASSRRAAYVYVVGRNMQGVRIMSMDEGDTLTAVVRVPKDESAGPEAAADADGEIDDGPDQADMVE